jgi:hypothetical protein
MSNFSKTLGAGGFTANRDGEPVTLDEVSGNFSKTLEADGWRADRGEAEESDYTGPLDLVPGAVVAYSSRAMAAAWVGNAIAVRKDGGSTVNFTTATNNRVDVAAVVAHLDGSSGFLPTWFDQSGNGKNGTQVTEANQLAWNTTGPNSSPSFVSSGIVGQYLTTAAINLAAGAYTFFWVGKRSGANGPIFFNFGDDYSAYVQATYSGGEPGGNIVLDAESDNGNDVAGCSTDPITGADSYHLIDCAWESGSQNVRKNGQTVAIFSDNDSGGAVAAMNESLIIGSDQGFSAAPGEFVELIIYNSLLSDADRLLVRQNIATYYGITLP